MVTLAKPQIISAYARPITKGAVVGDTNGFAGSSAAQMTIPFQCVSCVPITPRARTYDKAVDEEFNEKEISKVGLRRSWERTQDGPWATQRVWAYASSSHFVCQCCHLRVVLTNKNHSSKEGPQNLSEDVPRHFGPREL